ncbi:hypothetical protein J6590_095445 [Homalodisca vitripennis]|nr:hypothetical protein J6590_095445 [Homalodisca vitripennis]
MDDNGRCSRSIEIIKILIRKRFRVTTERTDPDYAVLKAMLFSARRQNVSLAVVSFTDDRLS